MGPVGTYHLRIPLKPAAAATINRMRAAALKAFLLLLQIHLLALYWQML